MLTKTIPKKKYSTKLLELDFSDKEKRHLVAIIPCISRHKVPSRRFLKKIGRY